MDREADSSGKDGRGLTDPLKGWGPTVFIVAGTLLMLLGVFSWGYVVQNTGARSPFRHIPVWLIMTGILVAMAGASAWWSLWRFLAWRATKTR